MVRSIERCLGSNSRKIRSNEHDPIIIDDIEVYLVLIIVICYCIDVLYVYYLFHRYIYIIIISKKELEKIIQLMYV